jgi:hypothetical protein
MEIKNQSLKKVEILQQQLKAYETDKGSATNDKIA